MDPCFRGDDKKERGWQGKEKTSGDAKFKKLQEWIASLRQNSVSSNDESLPSSLKDMTVYHFFVSNAEK